MPAGIFRPVLKGNNPTDELIEKKQAEEPACENTFAGLYTEGIEGDTGMYLIGKRNR